MSGVVPLADLSVDTMVEARQREYREATSAAIDGLMRVIFDAQDLALIEARRLVLDRSRFSLRACLDGVRRAVEPVACPRRLSLRWEIEGDVPDELVGDATRLRQALLGVLRYVAQTSPPGELSLVVSRVGQILDEVTLSFAARGPGDGVASVVDAIAPGDAAALGLSLSSRLAVLMGGSLRADGALALMARLHAAQDDMAARVRPCAATVPDSYIEE